MACLFNRPGPCKFWAVNTTANDTLGGVCVVLSYRGPTVLMKVALGLSLNALF